MGRLRKGGGGGAPTDPALLAPDYDYGWPAGGTPEPNVAAQWTFQAASGDLVDGVNGITLTSSFSTPSTPVYQVPFGKEYSINHTQGFGMLPPGVGTRFERTAAIPELVIGTGDAVIELVYSWRYQNAVGYRINCYDSASPTQGYRLHMNANGAHDTAFRATDGTLVSRVGSATIVSSRKNLATGGWSKFRWVVDRTANTCTLYINGVSADSWSIATLAGKSIPCPQMALMSDWGSTSNAVGRYAELRITIGNATNNSGGPGGG